VLLLIGIVGCSDTGIGRVSEPAAAHSSVPLWVIRGLVRSLGEQVVQLQDMKLANTTTTTTEKAV
jgi:hypothetical protein